MPGLIADVNVEGHLGRIVRLIEGPQWLEVWIALGYRIETFDQLGLHHAAPDDEVWRRCQEGDLVLITANRNREGPNSLEACLATAGPDALPVLTLADADRVLRDRDYAERVAVRILEVLMDIDAVRGCGRLYLP